MNRKEVHVIENLSDDWCLDYWDAGLNGCKCNLTENGVPPSGNTRAVVGQGVAGHAPGVVRSKWRE